MTEQAEPRQSIPAAATGPGLAITLIMPTIGWGPPFDPCLRQAHAALAPADELIVVFDGQAPEAPAWLRQTGALLLQTGERSGPAAARNLAARQARNPILLFVDADVTVHPDVPERMRAHFQNDPDLAAVFGSYDATPAAPGLVSRFRNLLHHHTHTSHPGPATSFWAGCGAVRRDRFLALGGFDAMAFRKPSIEDIEFGLRLSDAGGSILLDPTIQCTHLKRWTLRSMVITDIRQRAIPWSRLLQSRRQLPATLNLSRTARFSGLLSLVLMAALLSLLLPGLRAWSALIGLTALVGMLVLNRSLMILLFQRGGASLALAGAGLLPLYYCYSSLVFAGVNIIGRGSRSRNAR